MKPLFHDLVHLLLQRRVSGKVWMVQSLNGIVRDLVRVNAGVVPSLDGSRSN